MMLVVYVGCGSILSTRRNLSFPTAAFKLLLLSLSQPHNRGCWTNNWWRKYHQYDVRFTKWDGRKGQLVVPQRQASHSGLALFKRLSAQCPIPLFSSHFSIEVYPHDTFHLLKPHLRSKSSGALSAGHSMHANTFALKAHHGLWGSVAGVSSWMAGLVPHSV